MDAPALSRGDKDRPGGDDPRSELGPRDGVPWRENCEGPVPVISELALGRRPVDVSIYVHVYGSYNGSYLVGAELGHLDLTVLSPGSYFASRLAQTQY